MDAKQLKWGIFLGAFMVTHACYGIPTGPIKHAEVKPRNKFGDVYYDVTCSPAPVANGSSSRFYGNHAGTGYDYTNGKQTFNTPMTRYPTFRDPTLNEFNELVGTPYCLLPHPDVASGEIKTGNYDQKNYQVSCSNQQLPALFRPNHFGTCYDYTNGKDTFHTPMTCFPDFRDPTLEEFNQLVGQPYCVIPLPNVKSSKIKKGDYDQVYYEVTCPNDVASTFTPNHPGTCYDYTNGKDTFRTPMTCSPDFRNPTLEEFDQLVGRPYCAKLVNGS